MGYYQGDFYAGARGDPGFFSFLGKVAKSAVGLIPGVGGTVARVVEKIGSHVPPGAIQAAKTAGRAVAKHPVLTAAGAAGVSGATSAIVQHKMMGSPAAAGMAHARGVRVHGGHRRRMNVCNPKALRRAIRRTHGFAKLAMKTIHLTHPKKRVTFGGFKKRRKR